MPLLKLDVLHCKLTYYIKLSRRAASKLSPIYAAKTTLKTSNLHPKIDKNALKIDKNAPKSVKNA